MSADHHSLFQLGPDATPYRKLTSEGVRVEKALGREMLVVDPDALALIAEEAMVDINHLLRPGHLAQLAKILDDPEATRQRQVRRLRPLEERQHRGRRRPADVPGHRHRHRRRQEGPAGVDGRRRRRGDRKEASTRPTGRRTCATARSRRSPRSRRPTPATTLPAQIDIAAEGEDAYKFLFIAKGGGSANKTFLYQATPSILTHERMIAFLKEKILTLGTAACPPYHLAIVIGGLSAELNLKTVKLASARYLDQLPTSGSTYGRAFRDHELEAEIHKLTQQLGVGAQFGGKYFCHDVRVIRLPRHGASLPIGLGVSCSADRQALGKITRDGVFLEELEHDPARFLPVVDEAALGGPVVKIDLNRPMKEILAELTKHPIRTRLALSGPMIVARDAAHAKIRERLDRGEAMPQYLRDHPVYYAGPAKTPAGMPSGSFGPTTAGRMDSYVDQFQAAGGSMVMLAKGNRSAEVRKACARHGGFYLGSIGGPAARLAQDCIKKVEVHEYPELGMEAVWRIEVDNFPAFIVVDDKGNDFFKELNLG